MEHTSETTIEKDKRETLHRRKSTGKRWEGKRGPRHQNVHLFAYGRRETHQASLCDGRAAIDCWDVLCIISLDWRYVIVCIVCVCSPSICLLLSSLSSSLLLW